MAARFGGNSPGAWQFGAVHGSIVRRHRFQPTTPAAARTDDPRYPVCIGVYSIAGSTIDCAFRSVDADHVGAAEIDQPLHGRQTIVQGGNGK